MTSEASPSVKIPPMPGNGHSNAPPTQAPPVAQPPATRSRRPFVILGVLAAAAMIGVTTYLWLTSGRESTDDAQIEADVVALGARVGGLVIHVSVQDNQAVKKGDPLLELDSADYAAREKQAEATLVRAHAALSKAKNDLTRAQKLRAGNAIPQERLDDAVTQNTVAQAEVAQDEALLDAAKLQLSYARLVAPADGFISKLSAHEGQLLQPGQAVAELVPATTYVVANFKETQVGRMHPGQRAEVSIDAFPGRTVQGRVQSISAGTGARFALLPPDNASGNFVKVVQRVPVRIAWEKPPADLALRAGLSSDATVFVNEK